MNDYVVDAKELTKVYTMGDVEPGAIFDCRTLLDTCCLVADQDAKYF